MTHFSTLRRLKKNSNAIKNCNKNASLHKKADQEMFANDN